MVGVRKKTVQKCEDCVNAYGGCPFTETDESGKLMLRPVPGWTAEKVPWRPYSSSESKDQFTYRVIECPMYRQEKRKPRAKSKYGYYFGKVKAIDIHTKQERIFNSMDEVEQAGFLPSAVNRIILEGKNFHRGHRFERVAEESRAPCCEVCSEITRKVCNSRNGTCGKFERWKVELSDMSAQAEKRR